MPARPRRSRRRAAWATAAVSFRSRLLLDSLATLAVGLGALLVAGNVLLRQRVHAEASSLLRARAEAQIAALRVTRRACASARRANDGVLDRHAWVLDGGARGRAAAGRARRAGPRGRGARARAG